MKYISNSTYSFLMALLLTGLMMSCSDEENLINNGEPSVNYVRVTDPDAADSLLVAAGQGSMVAIMGENLNGARELWFNDRRASLSPNLITSQTIITRIPSQIPLEITNNLKIIFADGDSLLYDFEVAIGEPEVYSMVSEYVNIGDVATIRGQYFYEPVTVTFTGGVTGNIQDINDDYNILQVVVPEGAQPGPITVTTNFGEAVSTFWFRDNRNVIADFEGTEAADFEGWWHGKDYIVSSDPDIPSVSNQFLRIKRELGAWGWFEAYVGSGGTINEANKIIPEEAFSNPALYDLKFEINTLAPLTGAEIHMYMGPNMGSERNGINYNWKPNLDTEGQWQTVVIPFEDFLEANSTLEYDPNGYGVSFHFSGPLAVNANFGLDNIRVVPNTLD